MSEGMGKGRERWTGTNVGDTLPFLPFWGLGA